MGLLAKGSALNDPAAQAAWQQQFEKTLDASLTKNLQALDQLLQHSTALGQHFIDFQNTALAMSRQSKGLEHMAAASSNRLNDPTFSNALVGSQNEVGRMQADMKATFHKMEQNYQTVTARTSQTKQMMDQVMTKKAAADAAHLEVQSEHADMLKRMQKEQSDFDRQMQQLHNSMGANNAAAAVPTAAPLPPAPTAAPGAPIPDKYEVMVGSLEQQQAELEAQMQDLDSLLGSSATAFMAAVNATSTLKAENAKTII